MNRWLAILFVGVLLGSPLWAGAPEATDDGRLDGAGFENVVDPAQAYFQTPAVRSLLRAPVAKLLGGLDTVVTLEHQVPVGDGQTIFMTESFTLGSWLRWPHRAVVFLHGPESKGSFWSLPSPDYNATDMAARRGFFAYAVDLIGVGRSSRPADGSVVFPEASVDPMRTVLRYIRFFRAVPKIDLVGESIGGIVAVHLADDPVRVRSCVLSAMTYEDLIYPGLVTPEFAAFLSSWPDGYMFNPPEFYLGVLARISDETVRQYVFDTQPDYYPTGPFWQLFDGRGDPPICLA